MREQAIGITIILLRRLHIASPLGNHPRGEATAFRAYPPGRRVSGSLLPDSARIHIDFQTDGDFDDLRGLPGHFTSSLGLDGRLLGDAAQRKCEELGPRSQGETPRRTALLLAPAKLGEKQLTPVR